MKNVAKCDTWCELQNPVNHRVFERKLCPKPLGRGHVCLGVMHCVPRLRDRGRKLVSRALARAAGPNEIPRRCTSRAVVVEFSTRFLRCLTASSARASPTTQRRHIGTFRQDHPLSLSISISGGKETYKDSPSNDERTGNSPT
ncbi:hypothetical protein ABFS82_01G112000 [Erythranthe guttata]